ncbi:MULTISPECIES: fluoride efflux transporter FluC [Halolamina]|uniref:Fluoride-specific ion channel FluC n=1 Tax=Halolamina pelagica TaxID=699431 RepID=A0A1I5UWM8_9EURY|nr:MULTISPECIES: CrcB family protein [Halolamina]NHX36840.1 CrcB family protein [Halolamina sp. R1-12]SFP99628.1 CrcB protein [Halolamina pelagica]
MLSSARTLALVAGGGFAGANARWLLAVALPELGGTLAANVLGAFALGVVVATVAAGRLSRAVRLAIATGFLSSFTTYSTFAVESALAGSPALLVGNVLANYALGFAAAAAGMWLARRVVDADDEHHTGGEST